MGSRQHLEQSEPGELTRLVRNARNRLDLQSDEVARDSGVNVVHVIRVLAAAPSPVEPDVALRLRAWASRVIGQPESNTNDVLVLPPDSVQMPSVVQSVDRPRAD